MANLNDVTTGTVRLSYEHILKPYAFRPGQEEKYSCTLLIDKNDKKTLQDINNAIAAAIEMGVEGKWNGSKPAKVQIPIHDGDGTRPSDGEEFGEECKGCFVMTASSNVDYPPAVVDQRVQPIVDATEVYSGMYARVNVRFFPYNFNGRKGIGCALQAVQKVKDGEPLGASRPNPNNIFDNIEDVTSQADAVNPLTGEPMADDTYLPLF